MKSSTISLARKFLVIGTGVLGIFLFTSCEKKGPAEKAGEKMDESIEETGDAIKDATN